MKHLCRISTRPLEPGLIDPIYALLQPHARPSPRFIPPAQVHASVSVGTHRHHFHATATEEGVDAACARRARGETVDDLEAGSGPALSTTPKKRASAKMMGKQVRPAFLRAGGGRHQRAVLWINGDLLSSADFPHPFCVFLYPPPQSLVVELAF